MIIGKYTLAVTDHQTLRIPAPAKILSVAKQFDHGAQLDALVLYALIDYGSTDMCERRIRIYGTGNSIHDENVGKFIGTVLTDQDQLVWHIFDKTDYESEHHYGP